jgi:hypothetical protein
VTFLETVPGAGVLAGMPAPAVPASAALSTDVLRRQTGALLQHCYRWLEQSVPLMPQLAQVVPGLITAVQQYEAQQYQACLAQTLAVVQILQRVRAAAPQLPAL